MTLFCALLLTLTGAWLVYRASPRRLPQQRQRRSWLSRSAAMVLIAVGTAAWQSVLGTGAGISAALTVLMLAWVVLPYVAWWRQNIRPASVKKR